MHRFSLKCSLYLMAILVCGIRDTRAEDFRIENRVFVEGQKEPVSRSLTLFQGKVVFDFMLEPAEITIFDNTAGRFILLNMANREQTVLPFGEIEAFAKKLKQLANKQKDPLSKFFADPKFEERFDAAGKELTFASPWVTYRVTANAAENAEVAARYREFSDWYARINAMLHPGSRPPQARLQVNEALARRVVLPQEVHLTLTSVNKNALQKTSLRSEHVFAPGLVPADFERIQQAREAAEKFTSVPFEKYEKNRKQGK
ncbi:MAG: hypothetical protein IT426_21380 [Pirellulales bacterium]|nr:hypothetical protein [Pirellulales bacterium]